MHEGAHAVRQHLGGAGLAIVLPVPTRLIPAALHQHAPIRVQPCSGCANVLLHCMHAPPAALHQHLGEHQLLHAQDHAVRALDAHCSASCLYGLVGILHLKDALQGQGRRAEGRGASSNQGRVCERVKERRVRLGLGWGGRACKWQGLAALTPSGLKVPTDWS